MRGETDGRVTHAGTRAVGWLAIGLALALLSGGTAILPVAAWVWPVSWLVLLDRTRARTGLGLVLLGSVVASIVVWRGIIPAPGALYYLIAGTYGLVYFLPFLVHRLVTPRSTGFAATLVFPLAWVGIEFVVQRWVTPYGSWGSLAYSQSGRLALLQLASITGAAGISFLMTWFASVLAWVLRPGRPRPVRLRAGLVYGGVLAGVLLFGHFRLAVPEPGGERVRVAGLVPTPGLAARLTEAMGPVRAGARPGPELETAAAALNRDLLERTAREARAGARVVAWSETAGRVGKAEEPAFLEEAGRLARAEGIHLILAYGVWRPEAEPPYENKVVAVGSDGAVAWEYHKAHPIVGAETPFIDAGDGVIRTVEPPFGVVAAVICHDLDFPALLGRSGRQRIGLMIGPAADWPRIAELHADMARLRAIENGFTLFRPTEGGRTLATDTRGRTLASADFATDAVVARVAAAPAFTVYGVVGDLFSWLCLLGLVGMVVRARRAGTRPLSY